MLIIDIVLVKVFEALFVIHLLPALLVFCGSTGIPFSGVRAQKPADKSERLVLEAERALNAGDVDAAAAILKNILRVAPRNIRAQSLAGVVADKKNNLAEAAEHFAAAARFAPAVPETRNNYGAILIRLDRKNEAARELEASLKLNPRQLSALVNLARIRFDGGDLLAARLLFERAREIQNDQEIARALLVISLRLKDIEQAKREYRDFLALAGDPGLVGEDRRDLANLLARVGLVTEAAALLESGVNSDPSDIPSLVLLSKVFLQQKNIPAAGKLLESAVARGIDDARIYAALADVYQAGGYYENAIPAMRNAIEKAPEEPEYLFRYGLLLVDSKAPAAAAIRLNEYVKRFPRAARLWLGLGIAYLTDGKSPEARASFEKALELDPKMLPALAYIANTYTEAAQYGEAVKVYERAIEISGGKQPIFQYLLADTLLNIADADAKRIEALLKQAIELNAGFGSAYSALATLYVRQGRWPEAADALEHAVTIQPDDTKSLYQLSRVYARLKKTEQSQATLERFKRLTAEEKERKEFDRRELVRRLADVRF